MSVRRQRILLIKFQCDIYYSHKYKDHQSLTVLQRIIIDKNIVLYFKLYKMVVDFKPYSQLCLIDSKMYK